MNEITVKMHPAQWLPVLELINKAEADRRLWAEALVKAGGTVEEGTAAILDIIISADQIRSACAAAAQVDPRVAELLGEHLIMDWGEVCGAYHIDPRNGSGDLCGVKTDRPHPVKHVGVLYGGVWDLD